MRAETDLAIAGAGLVGLTSAACFCEMGYRVRLIEAEPANLAALWAGQCPVPEPMLPGLLKKHLGNRLQLTDRLDEAARPARALFLCADSPLQDNGAPDLPALQPRLSDWKKFMEGPPSTRSHAPVVVLQGGFTPGTSRRVWEYLGRHLPVVAHPDFLSPGAAVQSFFHPVHLVVGSPDEEAALAVAGLYHNVDAPLLLLNWEEAELVKYARDATTAMQSVLAHEVAALCALHHASADEVLGAVGLNP